MRTVDSLVVGEVHLSAQIQPVVGRTSSNLASELPSCACTRVASEGQVPSVKERDQSGCA
jgi:hypothetical protein